MIRGVWSDFGRWKDGWDEIQTVGGGGQGNGYRARRQSDGREAFVKVIKSKRDAERRRRFFREATAYDTVRSSGVPRLIESNAHLHEAAEIEPYIATEFIEGPTLRIWRDGRHEVELATALRLVRSLLAAIGDCHHGGVVHRDIKPDNIILRGGNPSQPVLLDFGLSFKVTQTSEAVTEDGQEIGNRFLRLHELSAGSQLKQDPRSDLSFAGGILFYSLTGRNPDIPEDAEGRLPHQRRDVRSQLRHIAGERLERLLSIFDSAFAPRIHDRFVNVEAMVASLENLTESRRVVVGTLDHDRDAIREALNTASAQRSSESLDRLTHALEELHRVDDEAATWLDCPLTLTRGGRHVDADLGRNTVSWRKRGMTDDVLRVQQEVREVGGELVIKLSGEAVWRTAVNAPTYGECFAERIRRWLVGRLREAIANPEALPPEASYFQEEPPLGSLTEAQERARREDRHVLAFVYDPAQKERGERGKLEWCLSNFLENRRTRETLRAAFVLALVPLSQVSAVTDELSGESMETSRWVVFDADLAPKRHEVIYANPQMAESLAGELSDEFGRR